MLPHWYLHSFGAKHQHQQNMSSKVYHISKGQPSLSHTHSPETAIYQAIWLYQTALEHLSNFLNCRQQGKSLARLNAWGSHQQRKCYFSLSDFSLSRLMLYWPYVHFHLTPDPANTGRVSKLLTRDGGNYSFGCQVPEHLHSSKWWYWYTLLLLQINKASWSTKKGTVLNQVIVTTVLSSWCTPFEAHLSPVQSPVQSQTMDLPSTVIPEHVLSPNHCCTVLSRPLIYVHFIRIRFMQRSSWNTVSSFYSLLGFQHPESGVRRLLQWATALYAAVVRRRRS